LRCSPIKVVCNPSPSPLLPIPLQRRHSTLSVPLSFLLNAASQARSPLPSACTRRRRHPCRSTPPRVQARPRRSRSGHLVNDVKPRCAPVKLPQSACPAHRSFTGIRLPRRL
jgi:hypothetical protein